MCQTHVKTQSVLCSFFGKFDMLCILVTPVLRSVLFPYYRRHQDLQSVPRRNSAQIRA